MIRTLKHHESKRLIAAAALALSTGFAAAPAHATLFTYTMDGGSFTGTINGTAFTNASINITATGDSASVVYSNAGAIPVYQLTATPTFTITEGANSWTGTLLQTSGQDWAVTSADLSSFSPVPFPYQYQAGFIAGSIFGGVTCLPGVATNVGTVSDLASSTSYTGTFQSGSPNCTLSSSLGPLFVASYDNTVTGTFVATTSGGTVPLPATLPLLVGGLAACVIRRRRSA